MASEQLGLKDCMKVANKRSICLACGSIHCVQKLVMCQEEGSVLFKKVFGPVPASTSRQHSAGLATVNTSAMIMIIFWTRVVVLTCIFLYFYFASAYDPSQC